MPDLEPAIELAQAASKSYPGDSAEYRAARTALLAEEIELRRHIERVAAQCRALPLGGEPKAERRAKAYGGDCAQRLHAA